MGYVGTAPLSGDYRKLDDISGSFNGSTTDFTLQVGSANVTPPKETTMLISVGGILQEPITAYTVSGSTISFTAAPAADSDFFGILLGDTMAIGTPSDGTITAAKVEDTFISGQTEITSGLAAADELLYSDGGTVKKVGLDNFIELAPTLATEDAVADGDYILFLDGGASGNMNKEAVHDLATLFAGAGMTATSSVLNVIGGNGITANANDIAVTAAQTTITSIYATDLIIGEDSETAIDFGTANEIDFKINNTAELTLDATALYPVAASGLDLGTAALEFGNIYVGDDKKIYLGTGSDASIEYDEDGTDQLRITGNTIFEDQVQHDKDILLDSTPADTVYSGITAQFTAGEALEDGECVYLKAADTKMWKAVSNTGGTGLISADIMCVALCVADVSADATGTFLLQGFLRADTNFPTYTVGETLYVPEAETSGKNVPEGAVPDTDGDFVQVIGWAADANTVFFNPDFTVIEHA